MGRRVDVDQLVGAADITRRLGLRRVQDVHYFQRSDPTFPKPVFRLGQSRGGAYVWYWPDVARWARRNGRLERARKQDADDPGGG
ncbi:MAG: hypothetical protein M3P85_02695 [Actinomycetota bacterium]|nr:hypothetical protein [Actinomycetota bacterium]